MDTVVKQRIFVDMDGTIAKWQDDKTLDDICRPGYFKNLPIMQTTLNAVKTLIECDEYEVFILSSVISDGHFIEDKKYWLKKYLSEMKEDHYIFSRCGEEKSKYVESFTGYLRDDDILLSDFTKELQGWHGVGIKVLNGINGTKGTWTGFIVSAKQSSKFIAKTIKGISSVSKNCA